MTALPRLPTVARRALEAAGITTLEDCVREGRRAVAALDGLDDASLAVLDEAVLRVGARDAGGSTSHARGGSAGSSRGTHRDGDVLLAG